VPLTVGLRNDGRIPGLPDEVITEGPVVFPAPGSLRALTAPPLAPLAAAILAQHATFEALTAEAVAVAGGAARADLVRALMANPMVRSWDTAVALVDAIVAGSPA
jgi:alpha-galactosidase/6-phospho-beta-glucosidase family protein